MVWGAVFSKNNVIATVLSNFIDTSVLEHGFAHIIDFPIKKKKKTLTENRYSGYLL